MPLRADLPIEINRYTAGHPGVPRCRRRRQMISIRREGRIAVDRMADRYGGRDRHRRRADPVPKNPIDRDVTLRHSQMPTVWLTINALVIPRVALNVV